MSEALTNWIDWAPQLGSGLLVSMELTAFALLIGLPIGLAFALMSSSPRRWIRHTVLILVEIGRGAPALVVLQMVYYGLPPAGIVVDSFMSAVIALALTTGAYTSEIIRAGLNAVPQREIEGGIALGMTHRDIMVHVVIPQGVLFAVPALMGFAVLIFQATALAFTISVPELLARAYQIGAATFLYLSVLTLAGLYYLAIAVPFGWLVTYTEHKLGRHLG